MTDPSAGLAEIARECVSLSASEFGVDLDWSVASLERLDEVCTRLRASPSFGGDRFDLWWKLVGAYTGEVVVRTYGGRWVEHEAAPGAYAVETDGITGFPFTTAERVLSGEPFKSLVAFARSVPAIVEQSRKSAAE